MKKLLLLLIPFLFTITAYSQNGYSSVFLRVTDSATFVNSANTTAKHAANYADIWYSTVSGLFWKWSTVTNTYTLVGSGDNIYTSDGTLTGNRIFDGGGFNLTLENLDNFFVDVNDGVNIATAHGQFVMQGGGTDEIGFAEDVEITSLEKLSIQAVDSINFTAPIIKLGGQVGTTGQVPTINASGKLKYAAPAAGWALIGTTTLTGSANVAIPAGEDLSFNFTDGDIDIGSSSGGVIIQTTTFKAGSIGDAAYFQATSGASGDILVTATDDVNIGAGSTGSGHNLALTATAGEVNITGSAGVHVTSTAIAITDAASMDITSNKHTLSTSSATRTFTQSYAGDYSTIILTLNTTSCVFTFPAGALCKYNGVDSGDNTLTVTGVSGDKHIISILKNGTDYYVAGSKFGQ